jgi:uncharacterized protein (TIGR02996 family)
MNTLDALLAGIESDPWEETRWLVLADWLEEFDDPRRAELLRLHRRLLATRCEPNAHPERTAWHARIVDLLCAGVTPCTPRRTLTLPGAVRLDCAFVPPGTVRVLDVSGKEHRVEIHQRFFMGVTPVTQAQWKAMMGTEPSRFKGADRPAENVSHTDAATFCQRLEIWLDKSHAVRLPTNAAWIHACRAGATTEYWSGDGEAALARVGWYSTNSKGETQPVGQLAPNPWGLYDLHGNVQEWCQPMPWPGQPDLEHTGLQSRHRRLKGGSWTRPPSHARTDGTVSAVGDNRHYDRGFRVVIF